MRTPRILTVFWHSIENRCLLPSTKNPTVELFREHVKFLVKNYTAISVFDFLQIHERKMTRAYAKPPILLGFDDGFKNVIRYALPILQEFKAPAVFFVIGEILRNPQFVPWYIEREHLIRRTLKKRIVYRHATINLSVHRDLIHLKRLFDASFRTCKSEAERQTLLTKFAQSLGSDRPGAADLDEDLKFVDGKELAQLSSSLLTVGSHAMSHRDLATLSYEEQIAELEESDRLLRRHCPSYFPVIAYPNGSFDVDTISIARRIYRAGFAVLLGASYRKLYAYPRIGIANHTVQELAYAINGRRRRYILPLKRALHVTGIRPL